MAKRFAKKHNTDANQPEIIQALIELGCRVYEVERPVDLLVEYREIWIAIEVKNKEGLNRITKEQKKFFEVTKAPAAIAYNAAGAIEIVERAWHKSIENKIF